MRSLLLIPAAAAAVALTGCSLADDGPRTTQTRALAPFTRVDNPDSVDVSLHVGGPQSVRVHAGQKVIHNVRTEVHGGTLKVTFPHHGLLGDSVEIDATVPKLTGVDVSGSGDVDVDGVKADALDIRSDGSADVSLDGTAKTLTLDLDGSGNADLSGLQTQDAQVAVGGSGDADVQVAQRLNAKLDGSGDLRYRGHPVVTKTLDGSGDLVGFEGVRYGFVGSRCFRPRVCASVGDPRGCVVARGAEMNRLMIRISSLIALACLAAIAASPSSARAAPAGRRVSFDAGSGTAAADVPAREWVGREGSGRVGQFGGALSFMASAPSSCSILVFAAQSGMTSGWVTGRVSAGGGCRR